MGRGHRPRLLRGRHLACTQATPLTHTHVGHTHRDHRNNGAGWWGLWDLLPPYTFPEVAVLSSEWGPSGCPQVGGGPACFRLHPPPRPAPPAKWGAVAAAPGQYLMSQELLEPRARGQTLLVHLGLCPAPKGAWPFSQRAQPGGTQLPGGTEIWGPLGRSHRVREIGTPPPGFLRRPPPPHRQP